MSFPRYPKYKNSGVEWLGQVPDGWSVVPLKRCFRIVGGSTPASGDESLWDGDVPWATPSDLSGLNSLSIATTQRTITERGLASCGTSLVPAGTIVLSTRAPIGSLAIAARELCTNQGCKSLVPSSEADSRFYAYALSVSTEQLTVRGKGTTFLELSSFELGTFPLPSPSLATQRAIAAFLDRETAKIDALIAEQQRLIELLQEKRQAFISHAVTKGLNPRAAMKDSGIEWLGEVPEHWTIPPMFARYEAVLGKMVDEKKATGTCPVPYLRNADVYWDQINTAELPLLDIQPHERLRFTVRKGDILICEGGAGIGQTAIWHGDDDVTAFQKALHRLRPWDNSRENPRYLFYCMRVVVESGVMLAGGTATIPHLTGEVLRRYRFPCPPIREQQEIVHYLDATGQEMQSLSEQASHAITLLQERRSALISAAVTGQIDVRGFSSGGSEAA